MTQDLPPHILVIHDPKASADSIGPAARLAVLQRFTLTTFRVDPYLMNPLKVGDVILCGPLKRADVDEKVRAFNSRWPGVTVDVMSWPAVERMCREAAGEPRRFG